MSYLVAVFVLTLITLIVAQSFNFVFGLGALLNLAHLSAYAIGAYTTAILATEHAYPFWLYFPLSIFVSAFFSLLVSAIATRLSQDYFLIGTLAFSALVTALLINWKSLTRGVLGIPGIPRPPFLTSPFVSPELAFLILVIVVTLLSLAILLYLFQTPLARALRAQGELEAALVSLGRDTHLIRTLALVISSAFAGAAGSLIALYLSYIDPSSFGLHEMVLVLSIVILGRPGHFWGVIAATFFLCLLPEALRFLDLPSSVLGPLRQLLYAVILFGVVFQRRAVLFPAVRRI